MANSKRSNKKGKAAVRDPSAYATVSVQSRTSAAAAAAAAVALTAAATATAAAVVAVPEKEGEEKEEEQQTVSACADDELALRSPTNTASWAVSLDLAQRQAGMRLKLELSLKDRMKSVGAPTIRLSPTSENTIISLMRSGALAIPQPQALVVEETMMGERDWTRAANFVYETLVQYGFASDDVEQAMMAAKGSGDIIDALTWLCVHIPTERMPVDMRDKHEFSKEQKNMLGRSDIEKPKEKAEEEEKPSAAPPIAIGGGGGGGSRARIDQIAPDTDNDAVDLTELGLANISDDDDDDEDDDPSITHARHVLLLRAYEEWVEYLQSINTRSRHSVRIQELRRRIAKTKRTLTDIESDLLFMSAQSLAACEQLWPEYHNALLDDIRRFRGCVESVEEAVATEINTKEDMHKPEAAKPRGVAREQQQTTAGDDGGDESEDSDESVLGFGELMLGLEEEDGGEEEDEGRGMAGANSAPAQSQGGPQVVNASAVPRGWTGAAVRDIMRDSVHRIDHQAAIKYRRPTFCASGGYTCTVTVTWSHPSNKKKPSAAGKPQHCAMIPGTAVSQQQVLECSDDAVTQSWAVPSELVVGATARDARDLAALVYLYTHDGGACGLLPPVLAALWMQWDTQIAETERAARDRESAARAEFLGHLRSAYELSAAAAAQTAREAEADHGPTTAAGGGGGERQRRQHGSAAVRARMWGPRTIADRRRASAPAWMHKFGAAQARLPARQFQDQITDALRAHQVCVIRGETGSGKSSQIPQYALAQIFASAAGGYAGGRVLCTQPRRISAMAIASRVSQELGDTAVGVPGALVGYQIRFNARVAESNALVFCTTGVLLRMAAGDPELRGVSCIICDEVQERTLELDFLLILLRRLLPRRRDLRLVLMSATVDASAFACYFDGCPVVDIPGRAFPVTSLYLPRLVQMSEYAMEERNSSRYATAAVPGDALGVGYGFYRHLARADPEYVSPVALATLSRMRTDVVNIELVHHLLRAMSPDANNAEPSDNSLWSQYCREHVPASGSVLVFLPGISEIRRLLDRLYGDADMRSWATIVPLHSTFANECAAAIPGITTTAGNNATYTDIAFAAAAPGRRKIVLSTNVAETGITIPDVTVIIDCGLSNQAHWDRRRRVTMLSTRAVSKANVRQRAGRAGRVQAGLALCLFTREQFDAMPEYEVPEMHRLPLASLCLQTKAHGVSDSLRFLMLALDPPPQSAVAQALAELQEAGALDEREQLTPIGRHLCNLPVDLHVGKLLIAGVLLGCLDPILTLAAALSTNSSILQQQSDGDVHLRYRRNPELFLPHVLKGAAAVSSDFLVTLAVYEDWRQHATKMTWLELRDFCRRSAMNHDTLDAIEDCREQYLRLLHEQGLVRVDLSIPGISLTRAIRPPQPTTTRSGGGGGLRQGFVVVPKECNANAQSLGVLYATFTMAFDHVIMPTPAGGGGHVIGQAHVSKRVEGIGHAIQIIDRERISTRPLDIDRRSSVIHLGQSIRDYALVAARLSSAGTTSSTFAHDLTQVSLPHIVLFSRALCYWPKARQMSVNRWIDVKCYARSAVVLLVLRRMLEEITEFRVSNGSGGQQLPEHLEKWQHAIIDVLKTEVIV